MAKKLFPILALVIILTFLFHTLVFAAPPAVMPVSPSDGNVSSASNITFVCNASDDDNVYNISLLTDINGSFAVYDTKRIMELDKSSDTLLMCRFSNYTCEDGESGANASTDIVQSRFMKGVLINDSDTLTYQTSGNMNYSVGTIEFWISPNYNTSGIGQDITYYLFSTDGSGENGGNRMEIYTERPGDNPALCFRLFDDNNDPDNFAEKICTDDTTYPLDWHEGEWHHIAVLWDLYSDDGNNNVSVNMFLNGSNSSMIMSDDNYAIYGASFGPNLYIGSSNTGAGQQSAVFDELRITNRLLSAEEINESYNKGVADHRNESVNWTINLSDGSYKWACLAYDNASESALSSNNTLYVDAVSPPAVNSITLSPSSEDDIDPNMNINITANVTDYSNVSSVMFQWSSTGVFWENDSMDYNASTGVYVNATINVTAGGVYYYRIWSNDTLGRSGYSSTYNVTALLDYTWNSTSDLGTAYGLVDCQDCYVGTLIVNNTGDASVDFILTDDWPLALSFNITNPFSLGAKGTKHINVTAQFADEASENTIKINITAYSVGTPVPLYREVSATLISYTGGPYCDSDDLTLVLYPTSAYHSTTYNLSAKLKNIGNETATGVWINWTLPVGWTNISGNLSQYIGDLNGTASGGNIAWNNITIHIPPESSPAGVQNLSVAVASDTNCSANKSTEVYVLCNNDDSVCGSGCSYVTDDDCSIPQTPGGGGATITSVAGLAKEYKIELLLPSRFDVNRGESKILSIGVNNTVQGTKLRSVYLLLSGYMQTFMSFSPAYIGEIGYGETKYFEVEIRAPLYAVYNEYNLNITTRGYFFEASKNTSAEKTAKLLLVTHKFIENKTLEYYDAAKKALLEIEDAGLERRQFDELLKEIEKALDEGNYEKVKELSEQLVETKDLAFDLDTKISGMEENIENIKSQSADLPETEKILFLSRTAFQRGDYERANTRLESAMLVYKMEAVPAGYVIFFRNYWWLVVIAVSAALLGLVKTQKTMRVSALGRRLKSLDAEEGMIKKLITELQEEYAKGKTGAEKFRQMMQSYENGLAGIGKKRVDILSSIKDILGPKKVNDLLREEEKRIRSIMADAQKEYFIHGKGGKEYYSRFMESAKQQLFGIQSLLENSMAHAAKSEAASAAKKVMTLFVLIIFAAGTASAAGKDDALAAIQRAEVIIAEMQAIGFGVTYANDTLSEAKKLYESGFYDGAESLAEKVLAIKEKALKTDELINRAETRIYELSSLGYSTATAQNIFSSGIQEFSLDNYVDAEKMMLETLDELDKVETEELLRRVQQSNPVYETILDYLWLLIITALFVLAAGLRLNDAVKGKRRKADIKALEAEKERIKKAVAEAQLGYFRKGSISRMDYEVLTKNHNSRLSEINRKLAVLSEKPKKR
jgi:hypothetical protein